MRLEKLRILALISQLFAIVLLNLVLHVFACANFFYLGTQVLLVEKVSVELKSDMLRQSGP